MKKALTLTFVLLGGSAALIQPALAQPALPPMLAGEPETIYSDAQREKDLTASRQMVETMLAPSFSIENQYARWKRPVCPHVYGLKPAPAYFIERRIREVATLVGAPVDRADNCVANIGIFFTAQPQASLMSIAAAKPYLVQGGSQKLTVRYPVEAWYATFKVDYDGNKTIDIPWEVADPARGAPINTGGVALEAPYVKANDSRLHTGLTTEMGAATVLVDNAAVNGMTLGALSDYLALMTLAQASQFGACQPLETIANLMTPGCPAADSPKGLSRADIGLLTALYAVPDSPEVLQKQRIVGSMRRSMEKQFGR